MFDKVKAYRKNGAKFFGPPCIGTVPKLGKPGVMLPQKETLYWVAARLSFHFSFFGHPNGR